MFHTSEELSAIFMRKIEYRTTDNKITLRKDDAEYSDKTDTVETSEDNEESSEGEEQPQSAPINMRSIYLVFGAIALIGIGAADFIINFETNGFKVTDNKNMDNEKRERICLMKVLSLFDGISCGMLALQREGIPVERYDAFEIDKYAIHVSSNNFPEIIQHGNVFNGDFTEFKGYDLLLGGSPCTYWSVAKKNREITSDGEGFRLFMEYVRALNESECKYFLYENNYSIHQNIKDDISK